MVQNTFHGFIPILLCIVVPVEEPTTAVPGFMRVSIVTFFFCSASNQGRMDVVRLVRWSNPFIHLLAALLLLSLRILRPFSSSFIVQAASIVVWVEHSAATTAAGGASSSSSQIRSIKTPICQQLFFLRTTLSRFDWNLLTLFYEE